MRAKCIACTVTLACVAAIGCGDSAAEIARRAAEERAIVAEKALAERQLAEKNAAAEAERVHAERAAEAKAEKIRAEKAAEAEKTRAEKNAAAEAEKAQAQKTAKVVAFQAGMKKFCEEARSLIRSMELEPSPESYKRRVESLEDVYSRMPEPPPGNEVLSKCYKAAQQLTYNFQVGDIFLKQMNDFQRLGKRDKAQEVQKQFIEFGRSRRALFDELEAATNQGRVPKIYE